MISEEWVKAKHTNKSPPPSCARTPGVAIPDQQNRRRDHQRGASWKHDYQCHPNLTACGDRNLRVPHALALPRQHCHPGPTTSPAAVEHSRSLACDSLDPLLLQSSVISPSLFSGLRACSFMTGPTQQQTVGARHAILTRHHAPLFFPSVKRWDPQP